MTVIDSAGHTVPSKLPSEVSAAAWAAMKQYLFPFIDVTAKPWGASPSKTIAENSAAFAACAEYCSDNSVPMYVPAGEYTLNPNSINPPLDTGKSFVLFGDGPTSKLIGAPGQFEADYMHLIRLAPASDMDCIIVRDLYLDQNARGSTPPASPFDYQRSAAILIASAPGYTQRLVSVRDIFSKDPVADTLLIAHNATAKVERLEVHGIVEVDRTRERDTVTITRLPVETIIAGVRGDSIRVEPNSVPTEPVTLSVLDSVLENELVADMDSEGTAYPARLVVSGAITKTACAVGGAVICVSDSVLRLPPDGRITSDTLPGSKISDSTILLPYDSGAGSIVECNPHYSAETVQGALDFVNVDFRIDSADSGITPTGHAIYSKSISSSSATWKRRYRLIGCSIDPRAQYGIYLYRNGYWLLDGVRYGGRTAAIRVDPSTDRVIDATIIGGDFSGVLGAVVAGGMYAVDQTATIVQIRMRGEWLGVTGALFAATAGSLPNANYFGDNTRATPLAALPASGVVGDTVRVVGAAYGAGSEYACTVASTTAATYRLVRQNGVKKGATANRPVVSPADVGLAYMDETVAAGGALVRYNGSAWVDASGATV